ncbi:glycosyltransferase [Microcoleus sp. FACHB-1515]|uniref:glycosyltransferase n=1 Tax=Cyanophyceae TaxID=3028117 RepID=UPI00168637D4|nr:glycosyltransferase [Microcoleus sp. FACHB-1515]MBD2091354.1 glycosyltransferase [Microcoleus sp. FACHB-1515]
MTLRVLQIVPAIALAYGGPSQMVLSLSKALALEDTNVTILTTDANGDRPPDLPIDQCIEQDGYRIRCFHNWTGRYKFSIDLLRWLVVHAAEFDVAHIHALFSPVSSLAAAIARQQNLPYLLRPLGTLDPIDLQKKRILKQIYARLLERSNLAGAAALHFTSVQEAETARRFGVTTRDWILPLGVELAPAVAIDLPPTRPIVLFLSRIDRKKGLDLLLPALMDLAEAGEPFHFVLAGSNPQDPDYERKILDRIRASPLSNRTTIAGFVTGGTKTAWLQAADLFVLPSDYENFGLAIAEAMAAGVPVIVSDRIALAATVRSIEAGWVTRCDRFTLRETLRSALRSTADRKRRGENGRRFAQANFDWGAIARQAIAFYRSICR